MPREWRRRSATAGKPEMGNLKLGQKELNLASEQ
jgi:hypothetical protein